jgi:hypothetical protein
MANKLVNGKVVQMTSAEETQLTNARSEANEFQTAWDNVDETKLRELNVEVETINKLKRKASAKQKLQDLGLTVDEIKEAFGI